MSNCGCFHITSNKKIKFSCGKPQEAYRLRRNLSKRITCTGWGRGGCTPSCPFPDWCGRRGNSILSCATSGSGYPISSYPRWGGRVPHPLLDRGSTSSCHGQGTSPFQKGPGISGSIMGWRWGTPPRCELTHKLKILPSPILWMRAFIIV